MTFDVFKWPVNKAEIEARPPPAIVTGAAAGNPDPAKYVPHPDLVDAVNVALALGMPLLLTGEPGTGKSQLAYAVAWQLRMGAPLRFVTKASSQARDLFYAYDALGRFHAIEASRAGGKGDADAAAELKRAKNAGNFIAYAGLGAAILQAHRLDAVNVPFLQQDPQPGVWRHSGQAQRSVVLIDEIDKAPRDFTNDLLDEVDNMQFRVPEIGPLWTPKLADDMRPIVIITSNSERQLPDAFLRRCLYYHVEFPQSRLRYERQNSKPPAPDPGYYIEDIVWERLGFGNTPGDRKEAPLVRDAIAFVEHLRGLKVALEKPPATAELLNWISAMRRAGADNQLGLATQSDLARRTLTALLKKGPDQERGRGRRSDQGSDEGELGRWLVEKAQ